MPWLHGFATSVKKFLTSLLRLDFLLLSKKRWCNPVAGKTPGNRQLMINNQSHIALGRNCAIDVYTQQHCAW